MEATSYDLLKEKFEEVEEFLDGKRKNEPAFLVSDDYK